MQRLVLWCCVLLAILGFGPVTDEGGLDLTPVDIRDLITDDMKEQSLEAIRAGGELVVLTRNAATSYYEDRDGLTGYEYDLINDFAAFLGVKAKFLVMDSMGDLLDAARAGVGHLAAANITRTPLREEEFLFGPDYRRVQQELVCHRDGPVPKSTRDLPGLRLAVLHESSYEETLYALTAQTPELDWISDAESGIEELFEQVWNRELDCTIADSHIVALNRRYFPELVAPFPVSKEEPLAWIVIPRAKALLEPLKRWFAQARKEGVLDAIDSRHFGFVERFDYVDTVAYMERIDERLPDYERLFRRAAREHDLSWTLLAAMGYQESHWDPHARSPTGVRGLMMLTLATAREVGVRNRLDPLQSIQGGAEYLRRLLDRLPEGLTGDDRLWVAMAAYNVGLGHVHDARALAQRLGKNPDAWADLKEVLPLLAKKKYYRTVRHGYARGGEPVRYVQRIRNYLDLLERRLADRTPQRQVAGDAL